MRLVKGLGLVGAFATALSMLAVAPGAVAAVNTGDGGSPATCPTPYTVLASATKSMAGGYIKVEMAYCAAWSVVWTRAYNYTSSTAWLATGIDRVDNGYTTHKQYDYTVAGTCVPSTFCADKLAYGAKSYGYQVKWQSSGAAYKSTVYYCGSGTNPSCSPSNAATQIEVVTGPNLQAKIAKLAGDNLGRTACGGTSLGGSSFLSPDMITTSCSRPSAWCGVFAGWVWWQTSPGAVRDVGTLSYGPESFEQYGLLRGTLTYASTGKAPKVGDAVMFSDSTPGADHVGIVYWVDIRTHQVMAIAGNEGSPSHVDFRTFDYTRTSPTYPPSVYNTVYAYASPWTF